MPPHRSRTANVLSRGVAPFAPLALALLMSHAVLPSSGGGGLVETATPTDVQAVKCDEVLDFQDCHSRFPTGCSQAAGYDAYLNLLKNQLPSPAPPSEPVNFLNEQRFANLDSNMPSGLTRNNHSTFKDALAAQGEGQTFGVVGYLYYAIKTGAESSNCQLPSTDPEGSNVDYHIGIGFDPQLAAQLGGPTKPTKTLMKTLQQNSVIVEMTPHYRFLFENGAWTLDNLQKAIGKQVKVVGQLIVDSEHNIPSQNCALATTPTQRQTCWRASVWELHPVERFQVCRLGSCSLNSADWLELDQLGG